MGKDLKGHELGKGIFQRNDGYYIARFHSKIKQKRVEKYFKSLPEAKVWLRDAVYDDAHSTVTGEETTVDLWFNYWLNEKMAPTLKHNTIESYDGRYRNRIKPVIGDMYLTELKPMNCQDVLNYCMKNNDVSGTMAKIRSLMTNMFDYAVENGYMASNPVTKSVTYKKTEKKERPVFTREEEATFKELAKESSYKNVFLFILYTGVRVGEVAALKWDNVDLDNATIRIAETAYLNNKKGVVEENTPKTPQSRRTIRLTNDAYDIMLEQHRITGTVKKGEKRYVFRNTYGSPIREVDVNKALKRITEKKMGIEDFTPHCLRHTFATRCAENGMKPKALQQILGHKSITTTMDLYVHVTDEELENEMAKIGELAHPKNDSQKLKRCEKGVKSKLKIPKPL